MSSNPIVIKKILSDFLASTHIKGVVAMSRDGIPIASKLGWGVDSERFSAISASLLSLADRAATDLEQGDLQQVVIESSKGFVLMVKVGKGAVLSVVSAPTSNLGRLLVETRKAAASLATVLQTGD